MKTETVSNIIYAMFKPDDVPLTHETDLIDLLSTFMKIHHFKFCGLTTMDGFMIILDRALTDYMNGIEVPYGDTPLQIFEGMIKVMTEGVTI